MCPPNGTTLIPNTALRVALTLTHVCRILAKPPCPVPSAGWPPWCGASRPNVACRGVCGRTRGGLPMRSCPRSSTGSCASTMHRANSGAWRSTGAAQPARGVGPHARPTSTMMHTHTHSVVPKELCPSTAAACEARPIFHLIGKTKIKFKPASSDLQGHTKEGRSRMTHARIRDGEAPSASAACSLPAPKKSKSATPELFSPCAIWANEACRHVARGRAEAAPPLPTSPKTDRRYG